MLLTFLIVALTALSLALGAAGLRAVASRADRSGWPQLARIHPPRAAHRFARFTTLAMSNGGPLVVYRALADVSATEHGLHLALRVPFARHPPILVPWEGLTLTQVDEAQATMQVTGTPFVVRVHASKVLAQIRYWLDVIEPPDDEPLT